MVSRRMIQSVLGALWFLDGLLQLKPQMFTSLFLTDVVLPTSEGQPSWITSLVNWGSHLVGGHIAAWNLLFALVQLALGMALMLNFKIKHTIIASTLWSLIVWCFGEGFGQVLTGQALVLTGAPGAAVIYALTGISLWPKSHADSRAWSEWGIRFAQVSLAIIWGAGFLMHMQHQYLTPTGFSQSMSVVWLSKTVGNSGAIASIILGLIELAIAAMLVLKFKLPTALWASILLSLLFWWIGQSFGQVMDPLSTDINTAPLIGLLSLCAYPRLYWSAIQKVQHHNLK